MTSKFSIDNRELLQRISSGEAVVGIDFGNLIVRELAAFRLAAMDSEPVAVIDLANLDYLLSGADADVWPPEREEMGDVLLYRHAQPALVVPDGYVTVPREPTAEMILSAMRDNETGEVAEIYELMLAAAPQSPGSEPATVPGKWIPVSEKLPVRGDYLVTDGRDFDVQLFNGEQFIPGFVWEDKITHWMPLPAAPQEVKGE